MIAILTLLGSVGVFVFGIAIGFLTYISDSPTPKEPGFSMAYVVLQSSIFVRSASIAFIFSWTFVVLPTMLFAPKSYEDTARKKTYGTAISVFTMVLLCAYFGFGLARSDFRDPTGVLRYAEKMDSKTPEGTRMRAQRDGRIAHDHAPVTPPTIADIQHDFDQLIRYSQPDNINTNSADVAEPFFNIGALVTIHRKSYYGNDMLVNVPSSWARPFCDAYNREHPDSFNPPQMNIGERHVMRILSIVPNTMLPATPEHPALYTLTFEWQYVPNDLGKALLKSGFVPDQRYDRPGQDAHFNSFSGYDPSAVDRPKVDTAYVFKYGDTIANVRWGMR